MNAIPSHTLAEFERLIHNGINYENYFRVRRYIDEAVEYGMKDFLEAIIKKDNYK